MDTEGAILRVAAEAQDVLNSLKHKTKLWQEVHLINLAFATGCKSSKNSFATVN
jgi:hypothetical protein